ncbi:hypothetical protein ABFS83_04G080300 [Erythranthe nasuta]
MKLRHISSFKFKLFKPCKRILHLFKFRLRRPVCIRPLQSRRRYPRKPKIKSKLQEGCISKMQSFLHSLREKRSEKTGRVAMLTSSYSDHRAPHSSPLTPAYVRMGGPHKRDRAVVVISDDGEEEEDDVEDACKSFEKYLIEMIGEDGKMRDLVDAEELLECWKNLNSPVYIDLVCRFYGELCKDLFSNSS